MDYTGEEILTQGPEKYHLHWRQYHIHGAIVDPPSLRAVFLLKSIQMTPRSVHSGPPTKLTALSPTCESAEFHTPFSMKAGLAPIISLLLDPSQDHPCNIIKLQQLALHTAEMAARDDDVFYS